MCLYFSTTDLDDTGPQIKCQWEKKKGRQFIFVQTRADRETTELFHCGLNLDVSKLKLCVCVCV